MGQGQVPAQDRREDRWYSQMERAKARARKTQSFSYHLVQHKDSETARYVSNMCKKSQPDSGAWWEQSTLSLSPSQPGELGKVWHVGMWFPPSRDVPLAGKHNSETTPEICKNSDYKFMSRLTGDK